MYFVSHNIVLILETSFSVESCDDDRSDMEESDDDKREQNQAQVPQA